jgi:hypothetical protein
LTQLLDFRELDAVVVGTGPAACSAARVFKDASLRFVVIDSALEPEEPIDLLRTNGPQKPITSYQLGADPPLKKLFGSDFAHRVPVGIGLNFGPDVGGNPSFAFAGHSNVWGANLMKFRAEDLQSWPVDVDQLGTWYDYVLQSTPMSSGDPQYFKKSSWSHNRLGQLQSDARVRRLLSKQSSATVKVEPSVLAVTPPHEHNGCTHCGRCLSGCPSDSIYSTRHYFSDLEAVDSAVVRGVTLVGLKELGSHVACEGVSQSGESVTILAARVVVAAGPMNTTALMLSAEPQLESAELLECQALTIPLLSMSGSNEKESFALNQANIEVLNGSTNKTEAHFQIYGGSPELNSAVEEFLHRLRIPRQFSKHVQRHALVLHGFMSQDLSARIRVKYLAKTVEGGPTFSFEKIGEPNRQRIQRVLRTMQRYLLQRGFFLPISLAHWELTGRSYHLASSFPTSPLRLPNTSSHLGCPGRLTRIHAVDGSSMPPGPPASPTLSVMAHSARITKLIASAIQTED